MALFYNRRQYKKYAPTGAWSREAVIKLKSTLFWGYAKDPEILNYDRWLGVLLTEYNNVVPEKEKEKRIPEGHIEMIPGFEAWPDDTEELGTQHPDSAFWNVPEIAMKVFEIRKKQE
jgi:hypothetical protein